MMRSVCAFLSAVIAGLVGPPQISAQVDTAYLVEKHQLIAAPAPGDTARFRIVRTEETLDEQGRVTSRSRSTGVFSKETVYISDGTWMDRYVWTSFSTGRTASGADSIEMAEVPAVRDFTYDLSSGDRYSLPPITIGGLAKTPETYAFFVLVWDAASFVQAATPQPEYAIGDLSEVGDRISETESRKPAQFDFTPVVSDFAYHRKPLSTTFTGITRVGDTPCAVLRFTSGGNVLSLRYTSGLLQTLLTGSEWIQGDLSVALYSGRIMAGEMTNMLVAAQTATAPGKTVRSPIVFRQHITLEQLIKE